MSSKYCLLWSSTFPSVIVCSITILAQLSFAQELAVSCGTIPAISECEPAKAQILTGGTGTVRFTVITALNEPKEYVGISKHYPPGLEVEAGLIENDNWNVVPGLVERLDLRRIVYSWAQYEDSLWKTNGTPVSEMTLSQNGQYDWRFSFVVPYDLAGTEIFFTASYHDKSIGTVSYRIPPPIPAQYGNRLMIVAPCSRADTGRVLGSSLFYQDLAGDYEQVVIAADSLVKLGWGDLAGLVAAAHAANKLGMPEKELFFLDSCFMANHRIRFLVPAGPPDMERQTYEARRQDVLMSISERENR